MLAPGLNELRERYRVRIADGMEIDRVFGIRWCPAKVLTRADGTKVRKNYVYFITKRFDAKLRREQEYR